MEALPLSHGASLEAATQQFEGRLQMDYLRDYLRQTRSRIQIQKILAERNLPVLSSVVFLCWVVLKNSPNRKDLGKYVLKHAFREVREYCVLESAEKLGTKPLLTAAWL